MVICLPKLQWCWISQVSKNMKRKETSIIPVECHSTHTHTSTQAHKLTHHNYDGKSPGSSELRNAILCDIYWLLECNDHFSFRRRKKERKRNKKDSFWHFCLSNNNFSSHFVLINFSRFFYATYDLDFLMSNRNKVEYSYITTMLDVLTFAYINVHIRNCLWMY